MIRFKLSEQLQSEIDYQYFLRFNSIKNKELQLHEMNYWCYPTNNYPKIEIYHDWIKNKYNVLISFQNYRDAIIQSKVDFQNYQFSSSNINELVHIDNIYFIPDHDKAPMDSDTFQYFNTYLLKGDIDSFKKSMELKAF